MMDESNYSPKGRRSQKLHSSTNLMQNQNANDQYLMQVQSRIEENIKIQKRQIDTNDSNQILAALRNHFIFYNLSDAELQNVKNKMFFAKAKNSHGQSKTIIYDDDTVGSCFFIVRKGKLQMLQNQKFKKTIKNWDGFGQIALLYNTKRKQTVRTTEQCQFWVIDRKTFRQAVEEVIVKQYTQNRKNLESIRFFMNLSNQNKDLIASALITQKFYKNQTIVQQGDPGSAMYYIKSGIASVSKGNKFLRKLNKGDSFGQQSLYYNTMRQLTVKADEEVICLVLGRDTLNRIMGDKVYEVTFKNFIRWAFEKNSIMSKLSKQLMDSVIESMKISSFKMNELIFRKGVAGFQKLVVVIQGGLKKLKSGTTVSGKCQCYGEQFLENSKIANILQDQVIMSSNGVIAQISDTAFYEALGNRTYHEVIQNIEIGKKKKVSEYENQIQKQLQKLDASDLKVVDKISEGSFGPLYLIRDNKHNQFVAKTMSKYKLQQAEVSQFVIDESEVMSKLSFPFVVRCGKILQSEHHVAYLTQYVKGQQFYQVLKRLGLLSTLDAQFYSATIILILEYFQNIEIICRDIKPQNFLVDSMGHLKLINLSTSKISKVDSTGKIARTFTIIGTPHYMAPDIVLGKGYTNLVDLWSLGVCLYEFLCGTLPFGDSHEGPYQIYEDIMQKQLKFAQFIHDKKAKKLIQQLLSHQPQQRHGGSFAALKNHPWFDKFKWESLLTKDKTVITSPYIPREGYMNKKQNQSLLSSLSEKKLSDLLKDLDKISYVQNRQKKSHQSIWKDFGPSI